jgi:prepilin-type processing-associated H-X9-DG protein
MQRRSRLGLTLVETIVVVTIVLVVLAILLPALQRMRNYAARLKCVEHQKDLGIAFYAHHDATGLLPQGGDSGPDGGLARPDVRAEWSWAYHLLPYLGREELHRAEVGAVDRTGVAQFYCPVRRSPGVGLAAIDYAGNAGSRMDGHDGTVLQGTVPKISLKDIEDGAACTVLVAERQMNRAWLGTGVSDRAPYNRAGWNADAQVYRLGVEPPARDWHDAGKDEVTLRFGSDHRAGVNALFADGSVRHIGFDIDATAWRRACVRDDSASVPKAK